MAHGIVYGICENKCQVEVLPKEKAFGIETVKTYEPPTDPSSVLSIGIKKDTHNIRYIAKDWKRAMLVFAIEQGDSLENVLSFQLVFHRANGFEDNETVNSIVFPWNNYVQIKYILPYNFKLSKYKTIHFDFFYDGLNICCRVEGY